MALIEQRDCHYRPHRLDEYRELAVEAGSFFPDRWEDSGRNVIWSRHPGFDDYLQSSVRFLEEV